MLFNILLVAHIVVLGYWLGSELVINSTYRYVSWASSMPFAERARLMDHVMDVDQHVRYALVLQVGLGGVLAALPGYLPGGQRLALTAVVVAVGWLVLVEATHRLRNAPAGTTLAAADRVIRYIAIAVMLLLTGSALAGYITIPLWLTWKLVLFAGVIACGLGIRWQLLRFFDTWQHIASDGSSERLEREIRATYVAATSILAVLWLLIAGMVFLSLWKA